MTKITLAKSLAAIDQIEKIGRASLRELPAKCYPNDPDRQEELARLIEESRPRIDATLQAARRRLHELATKRTML